MVSSRPEYPGARWWKVDFHTHTPASNDWRGAPDLAPEDWLLTFMRAKVDAVVVTDHNSGAWIDKLKSTYARMKAARDGDNGGHGDFRDLTLFPGVEISANGGVHILAVFDPSATTGDVDSLLGRVDYQGHKGNTDGVTAKGLQEVLRVILDAGAIPIPAHADQEKGLLQCREPAAGEDRKPVVDPTTLRQALSVEGLWAVEWCDTSRESPKCTELQVQHLARVLGSDWHGRNDATTPGRRYTWVKMGSPTLEGLRLALLDGNGVSIRRSDAGTFDPDDLPEHWIREIKIQDARYMGRRQPARLELSPFFNAIVGGRGTGKSTVVHALRLAMGRAGDLPERGEPRAQFDAFRKLGKKRAEQGALQESTAISVEWHHDTELFRITWRADGTAPVVEAGDGQDWTATESQAVHAERFPLQIFSQGEIASIAGHGRRTLLQIIDRAADVGSLRADLDDAVRTFHEQRARLRSLEGKLQDEPEVHRQYAEVARKLAAFEHSRHADVLRAFARTGHQRREIVATFEQAQAVAGQLERLSQDIALDDWSPHHFTGEHELLAWRAEVDATVAQVRTDLLERAEALRARVKALGEDPRVQRWKTRRLQAKEDHAALLGQLEAQGVQEPGEFARLTQLQQQIQERKRELSRVKADRDALVEAIEGQRALIGERRAAITRRRARFLREVLGNNPHVRITVVPYGFDPTQIERELRELLQASDERFANDILDFEGGEPRRGLALDLANATDKGQAIERLRERLLARDRSFGRYFRNHLEKVAQQPEFEDRILVWTPEDDLRIEYERNGRWLPIEQGSQGQRSAALLAFLLAFGHEPLVLDQPEDDLDNQLIYDLIVQQIRENKLRRQLIIVTHNPNVVVNGDAELVHVMGFVKGQCVVQRSGALQENHVREEVCRVMEGGHEAFARRWKRLGREG